MGAKPIRRVFLEPDHPQAYPDAVRSLLDADLIVIGPGSLYTSILPNLLVPGIADALGAASAVKVYACNVATQQGETTAMTLAGGQLTRSLEHSANGRFAFPAARVTLPGNERADLRRKRLRGL